MDVTCSQCQSRFKLPEDKLPAGKAVTLTCPKCGGKMIVGAEKNRTAPASGRQVVSGGSEAGYDASEKPFDFIEEEGKTALICTSDAAAAETVVTALQAFDYHISTAQNVREALKNMRYHTYDLFAIDESFDAADPDANGVLLYLERLNMALRRNMFVVLITRRFRTMDPMMTFNKSVNLIVNEKNLDRFDKILRRGIADNDFFYRVFKETLRKVQQV